LKNSGAGDGWSAPVIAVLGRRCESTFFIALRRPPF
jgi:hypothetical protein